MILVFTFRFIYKKIISKPDELILINECKELARYSIMTNIDNIMFLGALNGNLYILIEDQLKLIKVLLVSLIF